MMETVVKYFVEDVHGQTIEVFETREEAQKFVDFEKDQIINFKEVKK